MLLLLQSGEQRCPMCQARFGSASPPVAHAENRANAAAHTSAHASGTEDAPPAQYATTRVEVETALRHRRRRGVTTSDGPSAAPICELRFEAAAFVEPPPTAHKPFAPPPEPIIVDLPEEAIREVRTSVDPPSFPSTGVKPRPVPEPSAPAVVVPPPVARVVPPPPPPVARVVAPAATPAPFVLARPEPAPVDSIRALLPDPVAPRVRWWDRVPLRWKIELVERPEFGPPAPEPVRPPKPRAVEAPKAPASPPARARVAPAPAPRPAPQPREPNPMWRDRVFRGAPDDVQLAPVTWPRRTNA